ncbi:MAG: hypothetical protein HPY57_13450 [Ignavibacteria bacterium]|nr:hypothetical protein [Ignavibacteria bacterium]
MPEELKNNVQEITNTNDFVIEDENKITAENVIDPLDNLVNHDFSSDNEINLDESYEMLNLIERENNIAKTFEAENVIKELEHLYVDVKYKEKLTKSFNNVKSFINKYNIEKEEVKNMTEDEKTKIFAIGSFLNKNISHILNELQFNITFTREEYKFIESAIRKLTYDGNEVFNIIELNEKYLKQWKELDKSLPKNLNSMIVTIDIKNVVMLYHFLSKHTVKGLDKEFYTFATVLQKIADINKLYNAYNVLKERLNTDFRIWTGAMEPEQPVKGFVPEQE